MFKLETSLFSQKYLPTAEVLPPEKIFQKLQVVLVALLGLKQISEAEALQIIDHNNLENSLVALGNSLEYIDPNLKSLLQKVVPDLQSQFPWLSSIVVLGSAANGGMLIRRILGRINNSIYRVDFDFAVIYDPTKIDRSKDIDLQMLLLDEALDKKMRDHAREYEFPDTFFGCHSLNARYFHTPDLTLPNLPTRGRIIPYIYYRPSVPVEVSPQNRALLAGKVNEYTIGELLFSEKPKDRGYSWKEKYFTGNRYSLPSGIRSLLAQQIGDSVIYLSSPYHEALVATLNEIKSMQNPQRTFRQKLFG